MYGFLSGLRYPFRQISKAPGYALAAVLMLGAGIGATTAIFSLVEGVLLRPLPFHEPEQLVALGDRLGEDTGINVTARELVTYEKATTAFASAGGYIRMTCEFLSGDRPEVIRAARMEARAFETLGVQPMLGRVFSQQEDNAHAPVVVIGYTMWQNQFHRDPKVLGHSIVLDRKAYTIIGVMPRTFEFPLEPGRLGQAQLWVPMSLTAAEEANPADWWFQMVARLKKGVSPEQAGEDADRVAHAIMGDFPASLSMMKIRGVVAPLREQVVDSARPLLRTLFLAVAVVLLIACVNVAILMLLRAIRRRREYAIRLALGARGTVMVRDALSEGLLLSLAGGALGLATAAVAIKTTLILLPESMPQINAIRMDGTVAGFALLLGVMTGVVCSVAPAFAAMRTDLLDDLRESPRNTIGTTLVALRTTLVVAEIAIAMVLLTVALAFVRSYQRMLAVDPGFRPEHVLVAGYQLPLEQYATGSLAQRFHRDLLERIAGKPGTSAVGISEALPTSVAVPMAEYTIENASIASWKMTFAPITLTQGNYFGAMGIPLREGRYFTPQDKAGEPPVVIVSESMAKHAWPGQNPVGKRMHLGNPKVGLPWATVVGVVGDTKRSRDEPRGDQLYLPIEQPVSFDGSDPADKLTNALSGYIVLRSALPSQQMERTLRAAVAEIDPMLALKDVRPMMDALVNVEASRRFNTGLITAFALGALLLAVSGIYAVVAFSVAMRKQEIAIRMALGAKRIKIARMVLVGSVRLALLGCGLGVVGSIALSDMVRSFLFDVNPVDPVLYVLAAVVMLLLTMAASALPATRAAATEPNAALRVL